MSAQEAFYDPYSRLLFVGDLLVAVETVMEQRRKSGDKVRGVKTYVYLTN